MTEQMRFLQQPWCVSRSTLLIPDSYFNEFFSAGPDRKVGGLSLKEYLAKLLEDPALDDKLRHLHPTKWKKEYQDKGLELRRVNFYPDDRDWGRLSAISNATGFSRCFIFVYLMLLDRGVLSFEDSGTTLAPQEDAWNPVVTAIVSVNGIGRTLLRLLPIAETPPDWRCDWWSGPQ